jgi:hypothetical protein
VVGEGPDNGRISVDLRVGVTGHRWLHSEDETLAEVVRDVLRELRDVCAVSSTATTRVGLTVLSSLAEGADRVVAAAGLAIGARLEVVLPLAESDYRTDFGDAESDGQFATLLAEAASVTVAPGSRPRPAAYEVAGETVLQRSDVMLALWDGLPSRGPGGTAELVAATEAAGKPLVWIEVARPAEGGPTPPPVVRLMPTTVTVLGRAAFESLDWFNRQQVELPHPERPPDGFPQSGAVARYALPYFLRADLLAQRVQRRFRWMSRALYALSVVAIGIAAAQLAYGWSPKIVWGELAALVLIVGLLVLGRRTGLLRRWLAVRFFAERVRSLAFLVELTEEGALHRSAPDDTSDSPVNEWMRRALSELWIRAPRAPATPEELFHTVRVRLTQDWVRPQIAYHRAVSRHAETAQRTFSFMSIGLFLVSIVAALVHSVEPAEPDAPPGSIAFVSLIVPAIAAALSGYSAQRDYLRIAIRSAGMARNLEAGLRELESARNLEQLRRAAVRLEVQQQGEVVDWYAATRLREPEVP